MSFPIPTTTPERAPGTPPRPSPIQPSPTSLPNHQVHINPHNPEAPKDLRSIFFNPDLDTSAQFIQALLHPNNSLAGIALENKTTIEALSAWMAEPDVALRIFNMKRAAAVQHSLAATFQLKHATNALVIILQEFADSACHAAGIQAGRGASPSEHIRRDRETARKASHLLARLANFDQSIRPPRKHTLIQNPRGHAGATGATPRTAHPAPTPEDPSALITDIHALLAHIGAPPIAHDPVPRVADMPNGAPTPQALSTQKPAPLTTQARQPGRQLDTTEPATSLPATPEPSHPHAEDLPGNTRGTERGPATNTPGRAAGQTHARSDPSHPCSSVAPPPRARDPTPT